MESLSLSTKFSRSFNDPSTTEIPEANRSGESSPRASPHPRIDRDRSGDSFDHILSEIQQSAEHAEADSQIAGKTKSLERKSVPGNGNRPSSRGKKRGLARPQSAKQLISSPLLSLRTPRESVDRLSRMTSSAAVTSLYHVINSRIQSFGQKSLNPEDLQDIKTYFEAEQNQFESLLSSKMEGKTLTPYEIHKREKTKAKNLETQQKHARISQMKHEEEMKLAQQAAQMLKDSTEDRLALHILHLGQKLERQRKYEASLARREQSFLSQSQKHLIISNIRNFYKDRIDLLKEQINAERLKDHLLEVERRRVLAEAETERRKRRKQLLIEARELLQNQCELAQLRTLSAGRLEEELIKMYKRT